MYKSFALQRTGFLVVFCAVFFALVSAHAQTDLFSVSDITVDISAENAIKAREQAFAQAQSDAFKALAVRMMPETEAETFTPPDVTVISGMIQDFEVTKEQLSATRYVGTYTFRFNDAAVKSYFGTRNVSFSDTPSRPALVLPFMEKLGKSDLWSPFNLWMKAWSRAENLQSGLVPIVVPLGDLEDVADIGDDQSLQYDPIKLARLTKRYETGEAAMAIAKPDSSLSIAEKDEDPAQGTLKIHLYRTDRDIPEFVQELILTAASGETIGALFDRAVRDVKTALQHNWKAKTAAKTSDTIRVQAKAAFLGLGQWTDTKRALDRVYGLENLKVVSITPQSAMLDFSFRGDETRLKMAFEQAGLVLAGGTPIFIPGTMPGSMPLPAGYEIYLRANAPAGAIVPKAPPAYQNLRDYRANMPGADAQPTPREQVPAGYQQRF